MNSSDNVDVRPACPFCDGIVRIENIEENVSFNTPEGTVVLPVVVPYEVCDECGFRGFGVAGERARTGAVYDYLGRLKPWQIADIRRGLGLTQTEFADRWRRTRDPRALGNGS